jgi:hypothetical protein
LCLCGDLLFRLLRLDPQHQRHRPVRRGGRDLAAEAQRRPIERPSAVAAGGREIEIRSMEIEI